MHELGDNCIALLGEMPAAGPAEYCCGRAITEMLGKTVPQVEIGNGASVQTFHEWFVVPRALALKVLQIINTREKTHDWSLTSLDGFVAEGLHDSLDFLIDGTCE